METQKIAAEDIIDVPWNAVVFELQKHMKYTNTSGVIGLIDTMLERKLYFVLGCSPTGRKSARFVTFDNQDTEIIKGQYTSDQDHKYVVAIAALRALGVEL